MLPRLKTSFVVAALVLFALTTYLVAFNRARRRARIPAMTIQLPPVTNPKTGKPILVGGRPWRRNVRKLAFAPRGLKIAIGDWSGFVFLADVETGAISKIDTEGMADNFLSWSSDGKRILKAQSGRLGRRAPIDLFSTQNGSLTATLEVTGNQWVVDPRPRIFSPDGRLLAVKLGKAVEVWDVKAKRCRQLFYIPGVHLLSFSADSKWLASNSSPDKVSVWEVGSLK